MDLLVPLVISLLSSLAQIFIKQILFTFFQLFIFSLFYISYFLSSRIHALSLILKSYIVFLYLSSKMPSYFAFLCPHYSLYTHSASVPLLRTLLDRQGDWEWVVIVASKKSLQPFCNHSLPAP